MRVMSTFTLSMETVAKLADLKARMSDPAKPASENPSKGDIIDQAVTLLYAKYENIQTRPAEVTK